MKQTFKSLLKNYIKEHKQVTLNDLDFMREGYNRAEHKNIKFSTMERMLRDIVRRSERNYDLLGYRILTTRNFKGQINGYIVQEKAKELDNLNRQVLKGYGMNKEEIEKAIDSSHKLMQTDKPKQLTDHDWELAHDAKNEFGMFDFS